MRVSITRLAGGFGSFAEGLGRRVARKRHALILFLTTGVVLFGGIQLMIKYHIDDSAGFAAFCVGALFMISMSLLSYYLDKRFLRKQCCPYCERRLKVSREKGGVWMVECPHCGLKASTGYSGITGD